MKACHEVNYKETLREAFALVDEPKEKNEHLEPKGEQLVVRPLESVDAHAARLAGGSEYKNVLEANPNRHSGSAGTPKDIPDDQNESIEIVGFGAISSRQSPLKERELTAQAPGTDGIGMQELVLKARQGDAFASSLVQQFRAASELPSGQKDLVLERLQAGADKYYERGIFSQGGKVASALDEGIDTEAMQALAPTNEFARIALEIKESIEKLMPPGPERDKFIQQLKADISPALNNGYQVLIANSTVSGAPQLDQVGQFTELQSDSPQLSPEAIVAKEAGEQRAGLYENQLRQPGLGTDIVRVARPPHFDHPYLGSEVATIDRLIPADSWLSAQSEFPEIQGHLSPKAAVALMKAITANELEHYGSEDRIQDVWANLSGGIGESRMTLGFTQVSPKGVVDMAQELEEEHKQHRRKDNPLSKYLSMPEKQVVSSLEDPTTAPLIVAANIAHNIRMYERRKVPITPATLGYGFNPDISFRRDDKHQEHPLRPKEVRHLVRQGIACDKAVIPNTAILERSEHVANILRWFKKVGGE